MTNDDAMSGSADETRADHPVVPPATGSGAADGVASQEPIATLESGRYRLVERVGAGSIGQVWRAYDASLQREVAIKTVNLAMSSDPSTGARFRREAVATAGLDNSNVVQIYDSGVDGHTAFIVMEFLRGPNLQTIINREGPIPHAQAVPLLAQVAAGLGAAHAIGVTHRDVKPANVVLDGQELTATPKIVDFGIAHLNDQQGTSLTSTMTAIGSAAYMSPEQASGNRVSQASDMYSFGCLITTVLTGRPPFPGESPVAVARAQVYDTPTPLRQLRADTPEALETLVTALLSKDPAGRPNARETEQALRAIAAGGPEASTVVASLIPALPPTHGSDPTVAIPGAGGVPDDPAARTTLMDATGTSPATGTDAISTATGDAVGAVPGPGQAAGLSKAEQHKKQRNRRIRNIVLAVLLVIVLAVAVWFAFAQRDDDPEPTPSTVTMTTTASPTPTPSRSSSIQSTYQPPSVEQPTRQPVQPATSATEDEGTQVTPTPVATASPTPGTGG